MSKPSHLQSSSTPSTGLEGRFDPVFASTQAIREKQIQQHYRPVIGIHKWFARRPGTLFRSLLLAEYGAGILADEFWLSHKLRGTIADPFMGGGTTLYEASRLGFSVVGNDINPMAHWLIERAFDGIDPKRLKSMAERVASSVDERVGHLFSTTCSKCHGPARVKYFLWVKTAECPSCSTPVDVFPGRLLAKAVRHPLNVVVCKCCGDLGEYEGIPSQDAPGKCKGCGVPVTSAGNYSRGTATCGNCDTAFAFPVDGAGPPSHRLWAIEYNCEQCYSDVKGRQFKAPDASDLNRTTEASTLFQADESLQDIVPPDLIPDGDETRRLHRWGYTRYREMFNHRQLYVISLLAKEICGIEDRPIRHALLTVWSDILRYNNMLCRYDTYTLKCQDIFSLHGFPVGQVQCENNVLGISGVGSGGFRHFVEKYVRAKEYCNRPFETEKVGRKKRLVYPEGETIGADETKKVELSSGPSQSIVLTPNSLDGVFTDPPYFSNVQYAELIDFCYVWLKRAVGDDFPRFDADTTRSELEAVGNRTAGRGLPEFTAALSDVFTNFCGALKAGAPLVFTYHHNDPLAYAPLVVAVLDAGLVSTLVVPAAAEMSASMHIAGTGSSVLDSVFVCRGRSRRRQPTLGFGTSRAVVRARLLCDAKNMALAGVKVRQGDLRCLLAGHIAHLAMSVLAPEWERDRDLPGRLDSATARIASIVAHLDIEETVSQALNQLSSPRSLS